MTELLEEVVKNAKDIVIHHPAAVSIGAGILLTLFAFRKMLQSPNNPYTNVDLKGKVAIITGSNTGIGKETAKVLAKMGATVIVASRKSDKTRDAVLEIKKYSNNEDVFSIDLDLSDLASVRKFCDDFKSRNLPCHILINNAGVMNPPFGRTKQGFEQQFGINHLGHFLLTKELLPILLKNKARIVNVSSRGHALFAPKDGIDFDSLKGDEKNYNKHIAYGQSKLANVLFGKELQRRFGSYGVTACSLHPGIVATELSRHRGIATPIIRGLGVGFFLRSPLNGAQTSIYCAVAPEVGDGKYYYNCREEKNSEKANDEELAEKLWKVSEELVAPFSSK